MTQIYLLLDIKMDIQVVIIKDIIRKKMKKQHHIKENIKTIKVIMMDITADDHME